jgi:hypothetical protein
VETFSVQPNPFTQEEASKQAVFDITKDFSMSNEHFGRLYVDWHILFDLIPIIQDILQVFEEELIYQITSIQKEILLIFQSILRFIEVVNGSESIFSVENNLVTFLWLIILFAFIYHSCRAQKCSSVFFYLLILTLLIKSKVRIESRLTKHLTLKVYN